MRVEEGRLTRRNQYCKSVRTGVTERRGCIGLQCGSKGLIHPQCRLKGPLCPQCGSKGPLRPHVDRIDRSVLSVD